MNNTETRVLVAGATGEVGGRLVHKLLVSGVPVRAVGRNPEKLAALAGAGAEIVQADLRDRNAMVRACENVGQVYTSVNNVMGHGDSSPTRIDIDAHRSLCDAARTAGVQRIMYLTGSRMRADSPVDFFRIKYAIEEVVKASGVPWVLLRASAFMEVWTGMLLAGMRKNGVATLFGPATNAVNFIAVDDVVEYSARILAHDGVRNEAIDIGGPSNLSYTQVLVLLEKQLSLEVKRRHVPVPVLRFGGVLLRPFNEVGARMMRMGYFAATTDQRLPNWKDAAERFGVSPMSMETFVQAMPTA